MAPQTGGDRAMGWLRSSLRAMKARYGVKRVLRGGEGRRIWGKEGMEPSSRREGEGVLTCHCREGALQGWLG